MPFEWGLFSDKALDSIDQCTARINLWEGAVRSSKTVSSIVCWLDYAKTGPDGDFAMLGKTERTLKRNILDPIEQIVGRKRFRYNRGMGEVDLFGRRIYIAGANDERSEAKIRGMTLAGAYGDELTLWPESVFRMLMTRLSVAGARFFGTTNPDGPFHWLKTDYLDRAGELDLRSWHFELADNPNLPPAYIEALKREYTGLWYKRFVLGLWVQAEGAVYDMFDLDKHRVDVLPSSFDELLLGVDYGTSNPCVFVLIGRSGKRYYVTREYYWDARAKGRQKTDGQYADDLEAFLDGAEPTIYVDPSAASFIAELRRRGVGPVVKADNTVLDGIQTVGGLLANQGLLIHRSCTNTLREFGSYVWDPKKQKRGEDAPVKEHDHALDALRYALFTSIGNNAPLETGSFALAGWN